MKTHILFVVLFSFASLTWSQTSLLPGDIAIIWLEMDGGTPAEEGFAFFTRVELQAGTQIYFTDCGANASGFCTPCNEGGRLYTAPATIPAGSIITANGLAGTGITNYTDSRITGSMSLSHSGDQLIAFQDNNPGNATPAGEEPKFLFILQLASTAFTGDVCDSQQSGLPAGLSPTGPPITALGLGSGPGTQDEFDNAVYNGSYNFASADAAYAAFTNASNWLRNNDDTEPAYTAAVGNIPSSALPIELIDFEVKQVGTHVLVRWQTAIEINNDFMAVQRSGDALDFHEIGRVKGQYHSASTRTYELVDPNPRPGLNYYRLVQVDLDGRKEIFEARSILFASNDRRLTVFPNPSAGLFFLDVFDEKADNLRLRIRDSNGRLVYDRPYDGGALDLSSLTSGVYVIHIDDGQVKTTARIVKL